MSKPVSNTFELYLIIKNVSCAICLPSQRCQIDLIVLLLTVKRYKIKRMIQSFRCKQTQELFETGKSRQFANIKQVAERKLTQLAAAVTLEFLRSPPGNHLELLVGDRAGQYSIRINQQWRLCFAWTADGPADVEITDYH